MGILKNGTPGPIFRGNTVKGAPFAEDSLSIYSSLERVLPLSSVMQGD